METGWIMDGTHGGVLQPSWIAGIVEKGFWGVKTKGKVRLPVTTYRCPKCGHLTSWPPTGGLCFLGTPPVQTKL